MRILFRVFLISTLLFSVGSPLLAQAPVKGALSFQLKTADIQTDQSYLVLADTSGKDVALVQVKVDGRPVWLKNTADPVTLDNVIHWRFDPTSRRLVIDLSGVVKNLTAASRLEFEVAPLNRAPKQQVLINVFQTKSAGATPGESPKLITQISKKVQ